MTVTLPAHWRSAAVALHEATHKNIFSDCYLEPAPDFAAATSPVSRIQEQGWEALLDKVCSLRNKRWWAEANTIFVRDKSWYITKIKEPSYPLVQNFIADIRAGRLSDSTLLSLTRLPRLQLLTLLRIFWDAEFEVSESTFADFLLLYRASSPLAHAQILSDGIALDRLDGVQLSAIEKLAPDSVMRRAARSAAEVRPSLSLRLEQAAGGKTEAATRFTSLRLHLYPLRDVPTVLRLVVLKQEETIAPLLVTRAKE